MWECELKTKVLKETIQRVKNELTVNQAIWEAYQLHKREDRQFARTEAQRKIASRKEVERELQEQYHISSRIVRMSHEEQY